MYGSVRIKKSGKEAVWQMECGKSMMGGEIDFIMKKNRWTGNVMILFFILLLTFLPRTVQTAGKKQGGGKGKITCSVKKGTLTISGKGAVTYSQIKVKNKGKIKKIVVKKGITSLPKWAFVDFKKVKEVVIASSVNTIAEGVLPNAKTLKKVTMPGTFYFDLEVSDDVYRSLENGRSRIDTVYFNTPLSLETLAYVSSNHLIVSKKDKKYKSIGGVIYSKNGKSIVRVPAYRKSLKVAAGCEEFCLQSVMYANRDIEHNASLMCRSLSKITLPRSVKTVDEMKYFADCYASPRLTEMTIHTKRLDSKSILSILACIEFKDEEGFLRQFPYVNIKKGMCVNSRDNCLLRYTGKAADVKVPDDVKKIGRNAFLRKKIKRCVIPDTVSELEDHVFYDCGKLVEVRFPKALTAMGSHVCSYCRRLDHVVFPHGISKVPEAAFKRCDSLRDITLPDTVTTIEESAFEDSSVPASILLQGNIKEIKYHAFALDEWYGLVGWNELVLPATVEKVDAYAFVMRSLERATVCGPTAGIHAKAFAHVWNKATTLTLTFEKGVEEWQTNLFLRSGGAADVEFEWHDITGVDGWQIQVSQDPLFTGESKTYYAQKGMTHMNLHDDLFVMDYVRIRPFKLIDGNMCFGRWDMDTLKRN